MTCQLWGAKSPDEEYLIAMIADLKGKLKLSSALDAKCKKEGKKDVKGALKMKTRRTPSTRPTRRRKKPGSWKKLPPKDGELTTKDVGGKTYQWCIHHMAWGIHSIQDCRLGAPRKDAAKQGKENKPKDRALSYAAAMATIASSPGMRNDGARWHVHGGYC